MIEPGEARTATRRAACAVVLTALAAALPALWLPLLSDDWVNLAAVSDGVPWRTPFGYVRPIYLGMFRLGQSLWGLSAWPYHAVSVALFAICALLVFTIVRRLAGDRRLAAGAAVVFALHPFSIEATAWISSQADLLACLFALASVLAWDLWRASRRTVALVAICGSFVAALLSKESAIVVPALLALCECCAPRTKPRPRGAIAALLGLGALSLFHLFFLRARLLGVEGLALPRYSPRGSLGNAVGFTAASVLPLPGEMLELHRVAALLIAGAAMFALAAAARSAAGRIPGAAYCGIAAAAVAGVPSLFAFQERYFLLPSAGVALAFVALTLACRPRVRVAIVAAAGIVWGASAAVQWAEWFSAGRASAAMVAGLAREGANPDVREIVIANLPHRVRGAPVVTELSAIVQLLCGRKMPVAFATRVDYGTSLEDFLDRRQGPPVVREADEIVVRLSVRDGLYRRFVRPIVPAGETVPTAGEGRVSRIDAQRLTVRIPEKRAEGRAVLVWQSGALLPAGLLVSEGPTPRSTGDPP